MTRLFAVVVLLCAAPAAAQSFEVAPLLSAGYTTAAAIDEKAARVQDLEISGGFTWGGQAAYFVTDHLGVEALFAQQLTNVTMTSTTGSGRLFDMKAGQLLGDVVYQLGNANARIRAFVFGGLGATHFSADELQSETKFAWTAGAGVKWFPLPKVGVRGHLRYKSTHLNDEGSGFCDPFGFCQAWLPQVEIAAGLVLRF
jgi:opacity protein-like surface antigen